jgi:ABC-type multidrug transport system fused ATPase/permease subunit
MSSMSNAQSEAKTISASNREVFAFIWQLLKRQPFGWGFAWTSSFATRGLWILVLYCFKVAIDAASSNDPDGFFLWLVFSLLAFLAKQTFQNIRGILTDITGDKARYAASNLAMEALVKKDASFYEDRFSGTLSRSVSSIGHQFSQINDQWAWNILPFIFGTSISLYAIWTMSPVAALAVGTWSLFYVVVVSYLYLTVREKYSEKTEVEEQAYSGIVTDTFSNVQTVSLFGNARHELGSYAVTAKKLLSSRIVESYAYIRMDIISSFISLSTYATVLIILYHGWRSGQLSPGDLFFIQAQAIEALDSSWGFGVGISRINRILSSLAQTLGMMKEESKVTDKPGAKALKVKEGAIAFDDVSFSYKSGSNALKKASLEIAAGRVYALVGHSGAGKSTIVKMLLRMYDPTSGSIKIDGQDLRDVSLESLRKSIAYVPQDPALFHRSIADNIRYARPKASMQEVIAAAKQAQCHSFVSKLENGYDTVVGERGAKLSGGERQRVAIARAILKDAPILLLDEATSSLDSDSEHEVQKALEAVMKNRTSIIIAHRLSTIRKADRILVIEGGRIIDQGNHDELLDREGIYKGLWERQSGAII